MKAPPVTVRPQTTKASSAKLVVKLVLGILLVAYVIHGKMVDFEKLGQVLSSPVNLLLSFAFLTLSVICCALRWYLLVRAQGLNISLKSLFELTMIGNFFNTFMPGSVGGDLIKGWYIAGREPTAKTRAIFTVLLDRGIGLTVIVFYSAFTLMFFPEWLTRNPELRLTAYSVWGFTSVSLFSACGFFLSSVWTPQPLRGLADRLCRWKPVEKVLTAALFYRNHLPSVCLSVLLSVISILGLNLYYQTQGNLLGIPIGLAEYFFIVPIALVVSALPILPGGIGVGQVAFFTLFSWMGIANPEQGGTVCTLVQIYTLIFNSLGIFFYIRFRINPQLVAEEGRNSAEGAPTCQAAMLGPSPG